MKTEAIRDAFYSDEEQLFLDGIAVTLIAFIVNAERNAAEYLKMQNLDMDEMSALWQTLPAKVRTAIKRGNGDETR